MVMKKTFLARLEPATFKKIATIYQHGESKVLNTIRLGYVLNLAITLICFYLLLYTVLRLLRI